MADLSEYELQRLEHIKRNQEFLSRLGLVPLDSPSEKSIPEDDGAKGVQKRSNKNKLVQELLEPVRRSARVLNQKPDYTGETIDNFGEQLDKACARTTASKSDKDEEEYRASLLEASREWLRRSREALLKTPDTEDEWKDEAIRRWGAYVENSAEVTDWKIYVVSRMSVPPPPSPDDLLQEYYAHDVWQLLVCCVLMSRVSSWDTKHRVIAAFFQKYPTPSAVLDGDSQDMYSILYPLGLFENRMQSLLAVTNRFLEMPAFDIGLDKENKVYGIGEFSYHSYLIFCRDAGTSLKPKDKALASFAAWRKRLIEGQAIESDQKALPNGSPQLESSSEQGWCKEDCHNVENVESNDGDAELRGSRDGQGGEQDATNQSQSGRPTRRCRETGLQGVENAVETNQNSRARGKRRVSNQPKEAEKSRKRAAVGASESACVSPNQQPALDAAADLMSQSADGGSGMSNTDGALNGQSMKGTLAIQRTKQTTLNSFFVRVEQSSSK